jgi:hypothetical protein
MTAVLDNEEDEEGHLYCLMITQDLLAKDRDKMFIEQFAKLGLFSKVNFTFRLFMSKTSIV